MLSAAAALLVFAAAPEDPQTLRRRDRPQSFHVGDEERCPLNWKNIIAFKLIGVASIPHGEVDRVEPQYGIGMLYERSLVWDMVRALIERMDNHGPLGGPQEDET